jgi:cytochrome c6
MATGATRGSSAVLHAALAVLAACGSPADAADTGKGGQLYAKHCAACHGSNGVPVMPGLPNFTQPQAMMRSDAALATVIRNGRMAMPGYRGLLKDSEVYDVIAYMRTLLR